MENAIPPEERAAASDVNACDSEEMAFGVPTISPKLFESLKDRRITVGRNDGVLFKESYVAFGVFLLRAYHVLRFKPNTLTYFASG